ncbi:MAG TPA: hypothetical protein VFP36_00600 [Usitatibacter sp.]|nr:hypothetical protein [Usitatibacter sp.]
MSTRKTSAAKRRPPKASVASRLCPPTPEQAEAARCKFEQGVLARGEAVPEGEPLPRGATHTVAGKDARGKPVLKRKRFSTF